MLLLYARGDEDSAVRVGFTVTKKIGGAVIRNRLKRRLRAAARLELPALAPAGCDIVIIGRPEGLTREFRALRRDLRSALARAEAKL